MLTVKQMLSSVITKTMKSLGLHRYNRATLCLKGVRGAIHFAMTTWTDRHFLTCRLQDWFSVPRTWNIIHHYLRHWLVPRILGSFLLLCPRP